MLAHPIAPHAQDALRLCDASGIPARYGIEEQLVRLNDAMVHGDVVVGIGAPERLHDFVAHGDQRLDVLLSSRCATGFAGEQRRGDTENLAQTKARVVVDLVTQFRARSLGAVETVAAAAVDDLELERQRCFVDRIEYSFGLVVVLKAEGGFKQMEAQPRHVCGVAFRGEPLQGVNPVLARLGVSPDFRETRQPALRSVACSDESRGVLARPVACFASEAEARLAERRTELLVVLGVRIDEELERDQIRAGRGESGARQRHVREPTWRAPPDETLAGLDVRRAKRCDDLLDRWHGLRLHERFSARAPYATPSSSQ